MLTLEQMKKVLREGGSLRLSDRIIFNESELPTQAEIDAANAPKTAENLSAEIADLKKTVALVKANQSDVTQIPSVKNLLSGYDSEISTIKNVSQSAMKTAESSKVSWSQQEW